MALPRKKLRKARQDKKIEKITARADKKIKIQEAKGESRSKNILEGDSFGQKLGGAITSLASSAAEGLGQSFGPAAGELEIAVPPPVNSPAGPGGLPMPLILGGALVLALVLFSGKVKI